MYDAERRLSFDSGEHNSIGAGIKVRVLGCDTASERKKGRKQIEAATLVHVIANQ